MWDNHQALRTIANLLYFAAGGMLLYALGLSVAYSSLLPVRHIRIDSEFRQLSAEQLRFIAENELKGTFLTVDLEVTRATFERQPWIRRAAVRRHWPDRLDITIEEHRAIARWGEHGLLSDRGEWFEANTDDQSLPQVYGTTGNEKLIASRLMRFTDILASVGLKPAELKMAARQAWEIRLQNGIWLKLGRVAADERLNRFAQQWTSQLSNLPHRVKYIDLRYPNGFAVRMSDQQSNHTHTEHTQPKA